MIAVDYEKILVQKVNALKVIDPNTHKNVFFNMLYWRFKNAQKRPVFGKNEILLDLQLEKKYTY